MSQNEEPVLQDRVTNRLADAKGIVAAVDHRRLELSNPGVERRLRSGVFLRSVASGVPDMGGDETGAENRNTDIGRLEIDVQALGKADYRELRRAVDEIYRYPLRQTATDTLNRQLRSGISNEALAQLVIELRNDDRLCIIHEEEQEREAQIICSMGLKRVR